MSKQSNMELGMWGRMAISFLEENEPDVLNDLLLEDSLHSKILSLQEQLLDYEHKMKTAQKAARASEIEASQGNQLQLIALYQQIEKIAQEETNKSFNELIRALILNVKEKQPQYYGQQE